MRLGWSDLRRTVRRRNGVAHVYPTYLHDERRLPQLALAVGYFESLVGRPRAEFEGELLVQFLGDHRLARGVIAALGRHYRYRRRGLAEVLPSETVLALAGRGIVAPADLRAALYEHVNRCANGFAYGPTRGAALDYLAADLDLSTATIEALLVLDTDDRAPLERVGPAPTPPLVAATYNHFVAAATVASALRVELSLAAATVGAAEALRSRLEAAGGRAEQVRLMGPRVLQLQGQQDAQDSWVRGGRRLVRALGRTFMRLDRPPRDGHAEIDAAGGPYQCHLDAPCWRALLGPAVECDESSVTDLMEWDPRPEWGGLRRSGEAGGWTLRAQPEPLICPEGVLYPEFALLRGTQTLPVLLVDAPPLLARLAHLAASLRAGAPPLLVATDRLAESVAALGLPWVAWQPEAPLATVLRAAATHLAVPSATPAADPAVGALIEAVRAAGFLPLPRAVAMVGCADADELATRLAAVAAHDVRLVPSVGLHTTAFLGALQGELPAVAS